MKSLRLSRPLIVMVIGLPGAGKSFFARRFADMFGAPLVSADWIRHTVAPESRYDTAEDELVHALAQQEIAQLIKTGKTIIVDGGVDTRANRQAIEQMAAKPGYGRLVVWVQTDEPTSMTRSRRRSSKREGDELNAPMDQDAFSRAKEQFSVPARGEPFIVVSGKHTYATQARIVLKHLVAPAGEPAPTPASTVPKTQQIVVHHSKDEPARPRRRNVPIN
ncbi:MAG TPA: ATP-binding protein, partial [Candidatus Saccharimonadales bacterium]|jgi:hypothetical protein